MKKKVLGLAMIAMSLVAFNGMAQTSTTGYGDTTVKQETVKGKKGKKAGKRAEVNPFDGLTLTDTQKAQLRDLDTKRATARKEARQGRKEMTQRDKAELSAARKASKKAYLDDVKAIVGQEQYVTFLENSYVNSGSGRHGNAAMGKNKKGDRGKKSNRGQHASSRSARQGSANS